MKKNFTEHFKEAFNVSLKNKFLFIPNLVFFFIPLVFLLIFALLFTGSLQLQELSSIFSAGISSMLILLGVVFVIGFIIISLLVRSGNLYLQKKLVIDPENASLDDFFEGMTKYPIDLFVGGLLIGLIILLAFIPIILLIFALKALGILLLIAGIIAFFAFIICISFWEQILVYDDLSVTDALKRSYEFVKLNVGATIGLVIINGIIDYESNSNNNNSNISINRNIGFNSNFVQDMIISSLPMITIIAIIIGIIKILLSTYMSLVFMNFYHNNKFELFPEDNELVQYVEE